MLLKTPKDINIKNKRVLMRVGYDITLAEENGSLTVPDDTRIKATIPTIKYLLERGCSLVFMSWLKRPEGKVVEKLKMNPIADKLAELLKLPVKKIDNCVGPEVKQATNQMKAGDLLMLENTRFHPEEETAEPSFAKELSKAGEILVYDAFAQSHRVHASTTGILEHHRQTCCAGWLMKKEIDVLSKITKSPMKPFVLILGGVKISDKVETMRYLMKKASMMLIGGALANTFLKARGFGVGGSLVEGTYVNQAKGQKENPLKVARDLLREVNRNEVPEELIPDEWPNGKKISLYRIQLPVDVVCAPKNGKETYTDDTLKIEKVNGRHHLCNDKEAILDIGPYTIKLYQEILKKARTIFWNGPMGMFENFDFSGGTKAVAEAAAASNGYSVIGGGDTEGVVPRFHLDGKFGHVSTGGGASLELLAGLELPVLKYLKK